MDEGRSSGPHREDPLMGLIPLEIALGFSIGLSLGLLGGGGSILTVPALVYLVGQSPQAAVVTSLAIVGANSVLGAAFHHRQGNLNFRVALIFGGSGMLAAYLAAGYSSLFPPAGLLVAFALLMVTVGLLLLFQKERPKEAGSNAPKSWLVIAMGGAGVGVLTGLLGVGGGFLVVPALVILVGLPMSQAVGTSLLVIAANSTAGLLGHIGSTWFDLTLVLIFATAGLAGTFLGSRLANVLPSQRLRQGFAVFVIILASFILVDNLPGLF
jgi:uncharacterized protein